MKGKKLRGFLALLVCAIVLAWTAASISAVGQDLQYLIPAPKMEPADQDDQQYNQQDEQEEAPQKPNQAALELWESLQTKAEKWPGMIKTYTLSGILEKASFKSDTEETKQARLTALNENAFELAPKYLHFGRLFYPEELKKGAAVMLLDEKLALALFKISQPIGRTVTLGSVDFTVVGILRHTKSVGDSEDYSAYVPLTYLWDKEIQLQALQVTARPIPGAGARSTFSTDMGDWSAGGTMIDLGKEAMGAMLPVRVLLFFIGTALFFKLLALWNGQFKHFFADYKQRLHRLYAVKLMPRLILGVLALALGYGVLTALISWLITYMVAPVYTFTEWVPAILVEWKDIQTAFWQVWQNAAHLQELRSPELLRIRYFAMLTAWVSAGVTVFVVTMTIHWRLSKSSLIGNGAATDKE